MKFRLLTVSCALMTVACGGAEPAAEGAISSTGDAPMLSAAALSGAPNWVRTGTCAEKERICATGSITGTRNMNLARETATNRARTELGKQMEAQVLSLFKDYQRSTTGDNQMGVSAADDQDISSTAKQLVDTTLVGTRMVDSWIGPDGTFHALVAMEIDIFVKAITEAKRLPEALRARVRADSDAAQLELSEEIEAHREQRDR